MQLEISLLITLYTDQDGNDKFKAVYPATEHAEDMIDVTDQFELTTIAKPDGAIGFCVFKKSQPITLGCLDGPQF